VTALNQGRRRSRQLAPAAAVLAAGALGATAAPAPAAFPGDNGRIAYSTSTFDDSAFTQQSGIHTILPMAGRSKRLTPPGTDASDPAYSPDGRWIVYVVRPRIAQDTEIYRMRADGRKVRRLTRNGVDDSSPAWSRPTAAGSSSCATRRGGRRAARSCSPCAATAGACGG
jgi:dipeptidyl aminopeptidase/acylaminoacyl peptidase